MELFRLTNKIKTIVIGLLVIIFVAISCSKSTDTTKELDNFTKRYIQQNEGELLKTTYRFTKVSLNKEKETYLVHIEGENLCGTGGCPVLLVVKNKNGSFHLMNDFTPIQEITIGKEVKNGKKYTL